MSYCYLVFIYLHNVQCQPLPLLGFAWETKKKKGIQRPTTDSPVPTDFRKIPQKITQPKPPNSPWPRIFFIGASKRKRSSWVRGMGPKGSRGWCQWVAQQPPKAMGLGAQNIAESNRLEQRDAMANQPPLVGGPGPPLWNIWTSIGMIRNSQYMGK